MNAALRQDIAKLVDQWLLKHQKNKRTYTSEQLAYEILLLIKKRYRKENKELTEI